jgi:predicted KAP-like P-loop ATPase
MDGPTVRNDEPTSEDELNREQFASGFARLAETCETPLVIGLYGTWGMGKTSLMKLIEKSLDAEKTRSVWFNPWLHQFDESPAVALMQTIVHELELSDGAKDTAIKIARAIGSGLLNRAVREKKHRTLRSIGHTFSG